MSQSRFFHKEYSNKIRKVAIKAAIDVAVADLVAAINVRHSNGGKRLTRNALMPLFRNTQNATTLPNL
jgi:hypothetical protein